MSCFLYCVQPFPVTAATANANALAGWMVNASVSSSVQAAVVTASSIPVPQNQGGYLSCIFKITFLYIVV